MMTLAHFTIAILVRRLILTAQPHLLRFSRLYSSNLIGQTIHMQPGWQLRKLFPIFRPLTHIDLVI